MRIGYFTSKFPYDVSSHNYICGGSVFATKSLVNEISNMGHDVSVFTSSQDSKHHFETSGSIKVYRYGTSLKLMSSNISIGLFHEPLKYDVDIVHTSFDIPPGPFAGFRYAKKKDLPLVVTYHGDWDADYGSFMRKIGVYLNNKLIVDDLLSYADVIISPSKSYVESSKYLSNYLNKVRVIPNGVDLNEFNLDYSKYDCRDKLNLPLDKKIVLFFGYLSPYKSPDILLKAFVDILKNEPDTILLFAGNGEMEDDLKRLSKKLGIEENVIFAGFIKKEFRALYYRSSDIFCLPSSMSTECYPLAVLEAMASELPIVASRIGGIPDIINNGTNGFMVHPNNRNDLTKTISKLLKNPEMRHKLSRNAHESIKKYSWDKIASETNKIYLELGEIK